MQAIFIYGLKACIYSGIFFLYYSIALRNKRFHYYNRFYLLMAVAASLLLPFINIQLWQLHSNDKQFIKIINFVQEDRAEVIVKHSYSYFSAENISSVLYSCITLYLLLLLVFSIIKIFRFKHKFLVEKLDDIHFISTDLEQAPFSFFNNLFWKNTINISSDIGKQIFKHELTHIEQKHSCDKLFMRIVTALFFINPFYWLMQKELYVIHEFIADDRAIENKSAEAFALMLLQSQYGKTIFSPAQSFNYSPIKRRLVMFTTSKKPRFSYARRIMILPLLAVTVLLFAFKLKKEDLPNIEKSRYNDTTVRIFVSDTIKNEPLYIVNNKAITAQQTKEIDPNSIESINVIKGEDAVKQYGEKGKNGVVIIKLKSSSAIEKTPAPANKNINSTVISKTNDADSALIVVDGEPVNSTELHLINPDNIESITVLKDGLAIEKYGEKGKKSVIEITTIKDENGKRHSAYFFPPKIDKDESKDVNPDTAEHNDISKSVFLTAQTPPSFPGGKDAWLIYLQKNLNVNILTDKKAPAGTYTAVVSFTVDADGNLSNFKAEKDPGFGSGAEAIRIIQRGPKWIPAKQNGQAVTALTKQAISFVVEDSK